MCHSTSVIREATRSKKRKLAVGLTVASIAVTLGIYKLTPDKKDTQSAVLSNLKTQVADIRPVNNQYNPLETIVLD